MSMEEKANINHEAWMQKILAVSEVSKKEQPIRQKEEKQQVSHVSQPTSTGTIVLFIALFLLTLVPRFIFIFFLSAPENAGVGWNGDTYHHWQIGYLTYTTGLHHGFLRLWDLKGMEYFWGPLDPLLLTVLFALTGSSNIVIARLISTFFGSGSLLLLAILARRYWGNAVAIATFVFGICFPIAIQSDASGMLEPFGVFFMLLGIYFWPRRPLLTGIAWALATMVRAEAWLFSFGLIIGLFFTTEEAGKKRLAVVGWMTVILLYCKYLFDSTGNALYPVYWNFLANGLGTWADIEQQLTPLQAMIKPMLMLLGVLSGGILLLLVYKRPKSNLLLLLGFGNIFFVTAFMGFGHYIKGWEWWFPLIRFFVFPYIFLVMLLFVGVSKFMKFSKVFSTISLVVVTLFIIVLVQLTWSPLLFRFNQTVPEWDKSVSWGKAVGHYYTGGTVLFPEGDPNFTYTAVAYGHITGEHIVGEMFDPFYYIGQDEVFLHWDKHKKAIHSWLITNTIHLAVIRQDTKRYQVLIQKEPAAFEQLGVLTGGVYQVWKVYPERLQ